MITSISTNMFLLQVAVTIFKSLVINAILNRKLLWSRKPPFKIEDSHKCTTEEPQLATQVTSSHQISMTERTIYKEKRQTECQESDRLMNFV